MDKNLPVGVIDSGVGGLSVLKVLQKMLPHEDFLYIGDTARTPYGQRTEAEIRAFVREMTDYLNNAGIKLLVVACNTITVLGTESIKNGYAFDVVGMSKGAELALGTTLLTCLTPMPKFLRRAARLLCRWWSPACLKASLLPKQSPNTLRR